jgi:hypothetical protein
MYIPLQACHYFGPILRVGIANDLIVEVLVEFASGEAADIAVEKVKIFFVYLDSLLIYL